MKTTTSLPKHHRTLGRWAAGLLSLALITGCDAPGGGTATAMAASAAAASASPHVMAASDVEAGRYLVVVGGCNDCHTEGYQEKGSEIPEADWLAGSMLGWRGPWGTTYPTNLRLRAQEWTEDAWVATLKERKALPPMPWVNVNQMSEADARAIYRYIRSLGATGTHVPAALPPEVEPTTPYLPLNPVFPGS